MISVYQPAKNWNCQIGWKKQDADVCYLEEPIQKLTQNGLKT